MDHKLVLERKVEELLNKEIYPMLKGFPKAEKYALCQEIKQAFYGLLKAIMLANNVRPRRREHQEEADAYQKLILVLVGVSFAQGYISKNKKLVLQTALAEVGRLLGGWMKSTA